MVVAFFNLMEIWDLWLFCQLLFLHEVASNTEEKKLDFAFGFAFPRRHWSPLVQPLTRCVSELFLPPRPNFFHIRSCLFILPPVPGRSHYSSIFGWNRGEGKGGAEVTCLENVPFTTSQSHAGNQKKSVPPPPHFFHRNVYLGPLPIFKSEIFFGVSVFYEFLIYFGC